MKKIIAFALSLLLVVGMSGCGNKTFLDTTYNFDEAVVSLPDGTIVKGKVSTWTDYEDGDQIQVKIDDATYLVHSSNIVLISE